MLRYMRSRLLQHLEFAGRNRIHQQPAAAAYQHRLRRGKEWSQSPELEPFHLIGYQIGTFPSNLAPRGDCFGAPNTNVDAQLAKNWYIKERLRIKFSMDFFDLFNHPNFNSGNLESIGFTSSSPVYCGGATAPTKGGGPYRTSLQRNQ